MRLNYPLLFVSPLLCSASEIPNPPTAPLNEVKKQKNQSLSHGSISTEPNEMFNTGKLTMAQPNSESVIGSVGSRSSSNSAVSEEESNHLQNSPHQQQHFHHPQHFVELPTTIATRTSVVNDYGGIKRSLTSPSGVSAVVTPVVVVSNSRTVSAFWNV